MVQIPDCVGALRDFAKNFRGREPLTAFRGAGRSAMAYATSTAAVVGSAITSTGPPPIRAAYELGVRVTIDSHRCARKNRYPATIL